MTFSYADAAKQLSEAEIDEKSTLLNEEVIYLGSYAGAVGIENGMKPPAYEEVQPATEFILPPPPLSTQSTLISVYSEPIRIEYEENERIHQAGCGKLLWNYYACFGYLKEDLIEKFHDTNFSMCWTLIGCFCCLIPLITLLMIFLCV